MPFISKDWRSPGEDWVKYDGGWEKKSIVTIQSYDSCIKENTEHLDLIQQPKVCRRYKRCLFNYHIGQLVIFELNL